MFRKQISRLGGLLAAVALVLSAPAASAFPNTNGPAKARLPAPAGHGVVISSSGAPKKCVSRGTELFVSPLGRRQFKDVNTGWVLDNYVIKSDFTDHHGVINVMVLPEGEYQFYPYVLNPWMEFKAPGRGRFSVKAGETVYIGETFLAEGCGGGGVVIEVRDQEARDLAMLKRMRPDLDTSGIAKRLAYFDGGTVEK